MDGIRTHLEILDMLRKRNTLWVSEKTRPEIIQAHEKIIDLLKQTSNQYIALQKLYDDDNR